MSPNQDKSYIHKNHSDIPFQNMNSQLITRHAQRICDAHIHLFPERLMDAILEWFVQQGWTMPFRHSTETILKHLESIGVNSAFVLGYVHKKDMAHGINLWIKEQCTKHPWLHPFAALHQEDEHLEENLSQALDDWNFAGAKIHSFVQKVAANDRRLWPMYQMLHNRRKGVVLHISGMPVETPFTQVDTLIGVLKTFPNLKVIIAHMGLPHQFSKSAKLAANYPNVYLDTAFIFGNPRFPVQEEWLMAIEANPTKYIFGTDFPIMDYSPEDALNTINQLPLSENIRTQLLWDNAMRFLHAENP